MTQETSEYVEATDATDNTVESQAANSESQEERVYTQKEFNDAMAKMKAAVAKKATKAYEDLGDPEELRQIKEEYEQFRKKDMMDKGEFEKILQETVSKKDSEIQKRDAVIQQYRVDTPLLNAAAQERSVNPEQVRSLLSGRVRLGENGNPEVLSDTGSVRYTDSGEPMTVEGLVKEFLEENPHFVQPTPATTNSKSSIANGQDGIDPSKLDMKNPEHREMYRKMMSSK
jgi:hypothetical protein